jgi:hypothetical protein
VDLVSVSRRAMAAYSTNPRSAGQPDATTYTIAVGSVGKQLRRQV